MRTRNTWALVLAAIAIAAPAAAQNGDQAAAAAAANKPAATKAAVSRFERPRFEDPKIIDTNLEGVRIQLGGSFTQTFQNLSHSNSAEVVLGTDGKNANQLADIGAGFNLASANLNITAQLTPGTKVVLETYLSSRHHNETWVKGGYLQMDESPIALPVLERVMEYLTIKAGHYGVNYGDAHFRRSDNGNGMPNAFAEGLVLDAFTTEIGGEVIARKGGLLAVMGVTNGQNKGDIMAPADRSWAFVSKLGYERQFSDALRVRLTGSTYQNDNAGRATLYWGDRTGSQYWGVLDNAGQAQHWNGRVNVNFTEQIEAYQLNPFVQVGSLELFGVIEKAQGRTLAELKADKAQRTVTQYAGDAVYRLLDGRLYAAARYNTVTGELFTLGDEQTIDRQVIGGGWFVTKNVLLKGEYVKQTFDNFPTKNILSGGKFQGAVIQGVVSF